VCHVGLVPACRLGACSICLGFKRRLGGRGSPASLLDDVRELVRDEFLALDGAGTRLRWRDMNVLAYRYCLRLLTIRNGIGVYAHAREVGVVCALHRALERAQVAARAAYVASS